jgi:hypothetical protein
MAETESGGKGGRLGGWLKAGFTTLFGLASGAVLMYLTPLVDRVIKPSKPLANFGVELQGVQATFQNRAENGSEGWWDFGDGSPLEPFNPQQASLTHPYPRPGSYTAKLTVRSLFGEESERSTTVQVDAAAAGPPEIAGLDVQPARADTYAPATFRISRKVNNADLCVWTGGADQPLLLETDPPASAVRYLTFNKPGQHTIRLAVIQGKKVVERTATVQVQQPPVGTAIAVLNVTRQAAQVRKVERPQNVVIAFPDGHAGNTYAFSKDIPTAPGWQILAARLGQHANDANVKDLKVAVAPGGSKAVLTAQLLKPAGLLPFKRGGPGPRCAVEVVLTLQRQEAAGAGPVETVARPLALPGSTVVALPKLQSGWVQKTCAIAMDLYDGPREVQHHAALPANEVVTLGNRAWRLTATAVGDQVRIDTTPLGAPAGN